MEKKRIERKVEENSMDTREADLFVAFMGEQHWEQREPLYTQPRWGYFWGQMHPFHFWQDVLVLLNQEHLTRRSAIRLPRLLIIGKLHLFQKVNSMRLFSSVDDITWVSQFKFHNPGSLLTCLKAAGASTLACCGKELNKSPRLMPRYYAGGIWYFCTSPASYNGTS